MPLQNIGSNAPTLTSSLADGATNFASMMARQGVNENQQAAAALNREKTLAAQVEAKLRAEGVAAERSQLRERGTMVDENNMAVDAPFSLEDLQHNMDTRNRMQVAGYGKPEAAPHIMTPGGQVLSKVSGDVLNMTQQQEQEQTLSAKAGMAAENMVAGQTTDQQNINFMLDERNSPEARAAMRQKMAKAQMSIKTPDGFELSMGPNGSTPGLALADPSPADTKGEIKRLSGDLAKLKDYDSDVTRDLFSGTKQMGKKFDNLASKWLDIPLTEQEAEYQQRYENLFTPVGEFYNKYKKWLSGTAVSDKEVKELQSLLLNKSLSHEEFEAKRKAFIRTWESELKTNVGFLTEGIPISAMAADPRVAALINDAKIWVKKDGIDPVAVKESLREKLAELGVTVR